MSAVPREAAPVWALVLAFNEWDATRECLTSLRALDPAPDRTLLVDNGSTDSTPARARAEFPEVEVLELGENRLFAGGVNAGLERALEAGAASVLLLNNDVVLEREALLHLTAALTADPARGAVSPKLYFWDPPDRIWFAGGVVTKSICHRGIHKKTTQRARRGRSTTFRCGRALAPRARDSGTLILIRDLRQTRLVGGAGRRIAVV